MPYGGGRRQPARREGNGGNLESDARQARPDHGRRQQPLDRLGHRQGLPRRTAPSSPSPIRAMRSRSASSRWPRKSAAWWSAIATSPTRRRIDAVFAAVQIGLGLARFRACTPSPSPTRTSSTAATSTPRADNFTKTMLISCYSFTAIAQRAEKLMTERRLDADADLLRRREMDAALQRDGRRQGGARSLGALSRRRSRRQEHPRQRDLGRADQDARRLRHRRLPLYPEMERIQLAAAAQRDASRKSARPASISCPTCRAA